MKTLLLLASMFVSTGFANAQNFENGSCIAAEKVNLTVVRDLGDGVYETNSNGARGAVKISLPLKVGSLVQGVKLRYRGVQVATLEGGTSAAFGLWEVCQ